MFSLFRWGLPVRQFAGRIAIQCVARVWITRISRDHNVKRHCGRSLTLEWPAPESDSSRISQQATAPMRDTLICARAVAASRCSPIVSNLGRAEDPRLPLLTRRGVRFRHPSALITSNTLINPYRADGLPNVTPREIFRSRPVIRPNESVRRAAIRWCTSDQLCSWCSPPACAQCAYGRRLLT